MLLNILALAAAAGQATPDGASLQALYEARMSTLVVCTRQPRKSTIIKLNFAFQQLFILLT